ncbi:MAG: inorganic pyrophosphatase [Candidatus Pacebacteria bacterium]|nr:inorganic pyrophosphatase [Candidatus Paceibacterota bacterium]
MKASKSLKLARKYLGEKVSLVIDRPLGSKHPKHGFVYQANYGYVSGTKAPDDEKIDAYFLGINKPVKKAQGKCIAIIHRLNDDDDKLVVVPLEKGNLTDEEIKRAVHFQEQWFEYIIFRE